MDITIQAIHFEADSKLVDLIHKKMEKLPKYFEHIINADVFLKLDNQGAQVKDKVVHISLNLPGTTLHAKESSKNFEESLDQAVETIRRQLRKHKEKIRN